MGSGLFLTLVEDGIIYWLSENHMIPRDQLAKTFSQCGKRDP